MGFLDQHKNRMLNQNTYISDVKDIVLATWVNDKIR